MKANSGNISPAIIETSSLTKTFGDLVAVAGISFNVRAGECFGILGPNGAGKTSTIRMIYGLSPLSSGTLRVFDEDITTRSRSIKARIGVCPQENNLDPDISVIRNLEVYARYFSISAATARKRAVELLKFMSLDQRRNAKVTDLSGGMMRRLIIARALINEPDLLILDEPTSGLDPQSRHQVWERLNKLRSQGMTMLLTTHYMDEAARLCDRLLIMDQGKILVEGKPADLIRDYVGQHVIEVSEPGAELRSHIQAAGLSYEDLGHLLIIYDHNQEQLYHEISSHYCLEGCMMRMATLEDVFLKLTGRGLRE
ncbi:MAG: ATP-binding cassette domain-containing protein [Syntrophaceae bacterium]|nr:ATP-binding cassette domain-containing protein [Syntrophaceae bacterium]